MAVTLAESKLNAQEDYDPAVIDEFRKESAVLDSLIFDDAVSPTGGGTLDYGYRRLLTQPTAATRAYNTEYTPQNVTTEKKSITLAVLGGSFEVDRVLAKLGPAASSNIALNVSQKVKAATTKFNDELINGDVAVDANGLRRPRQGPYRVLDGVPGKLGHQLDRLGHSAFRGEQGSR